ncbi:P-granule-associated novel protein 1 [Galendromus occidentalis]|uniref:p-granule-associated novel protein 1 n=1 Tax=Galendromus occidentalis TaxID=34638 RepID=A0AAJ6W0M0_9ACAR|nr:P-granule-associated novel protein 1 [Galendromus occidentalis]
MLLGVILLPILSVVSAADVACPRDEYLLPFGCRCRSEGRVQCSNVQDSKKFEMIMAACQGYQLLEFTLVNAKLEWLPPTTFQFIDTLEFVLSNSVLESLTEPIPGNRLFKGSGVEHFILSNTDIRDGDLSQIGYLDDLKQLVIKNYPNALFLASLVGKIQQTQIQELILENLPHLVWRGDEIAPLNHLRTLSLSGLNLKEIRREDLPENVGNLENLWLKDNNLQWLPDDFLTDMKSLKMLDLSSNKFKTLYEETFASFSEFIVLHGNPLECDSRLDWLRERLRSNSLKIMTPQPIKCQDGSNLIDLLL